MHGFLTLEASDLYSESSSEPSSDPLVTLYSEDHSDLYSSDLYIVVKPIEEL